MITTLKKVSFLPLTVGAILLPAVLFSPLNPVAHAQSKVDIEKGSDSGSEPVPAIPPAMTSGTF